MLNDCAYIGCICIEIRMDTEAGYDNVNIGFICDMVVVIKYDRLW